MKWKHDHQIFKGDTKCITCNLTKKTYTLLDKLDKEHKPYSHRCSNCGDKVTDTEEFENFALAGFQSLHTTCEKCVKEFKKYK